MKVMTISKQGVKALEAFWQTGWGGHFDPACLVVSSSQDILGPRAGSVPPRASEHRLPEIERKPTAIAAPASRRRHQHSRASGDIVFSELDRARARRELKARGYVFNRKGR
jgi:hypothetical protein